MRPISLAPLLFAVAAGCYAAPGDPLAGAHTDSEALRRSSSGESRAVGGVPANELHELTPSAVRELDGSETAERETHWEIIECPEVLRVSTDAMGGDGPWAGSAERVYDVNELFEQHDDAADISTLYCAQRREDGVVVAQVEQRIEHTTGCVAENRPEIGMTLFLCAVYDAVDPPATCELPSPQGELGGLHHISHGAKYVSFHGRSCAGDDYYLYGEGTGWCDSRFHLLMIYTGGSQPGEIAAAEQLQRDLLAEYSTEQLEIIRVIAQNAAGGVPSRSTCEAHEAAHGSHARLLYHPYPTGFASGGVVSLLLDPTGRQQMTLDRFLEGTIRYRVAEAMESVAIYPETGAACSSNGDCGQGLLCFEGVCRY